MMSTKSISCFYISIFLMGGGRGGREGRKGEEERNEKANFPLTLRSIGDNERAGRKAASLQGDRPNCLPPFNWHLF